MGKISLLHPMASEPEYRVLPEETMHDLGLKELCEKVAKSPLEKSVLERTISKITDKAEVIAYRLDVFEDILNDQDMREELQELLDKINFMKEYASFQKEQDGSGIWQLVHRLNEMKEYIQCIEEIYHCLDKDTIHSEGLTSLRNYVKSVYDEDGYAALKKDINEMQIKTADIKSLTLGVNLNSSLEPTTLGVVSINKKAFTNSGLLSNLSEFLGRDQKQKDTEWKENYRFHPSDGDSRGMKASEVVFHPSIAVVPNGGQGKDVVQSLNTAMSNLLTSTTKQLKETISKHTALQIRTIAELIPELLFYVRFAEYTEMLREKGFTLSKAEVHSDDARTMEAVELYNIRLTEHEAKEIVGNSFGFDDANRIYILTGANRGGKTTITQAVGQLYVLAQAGLYVPAERFNFSPVDMVLTHFPADENKTLDLGRLGEESKRFREMYQLATSNSLFLLNESFSTTSFEEGYFIARDVVKAISLLGANTIYNTHMHKLSLDAAEINSEGNGHNLVSGLIAETEDGKRSYRIRKGITEGNSYARDIAAKYGVTFEQLCTMGKK